MNYFYLIIVVSYDRTTNYSDVKSTNVVYSGLALDLN